MALGPLTEDANNFFMIAKQIAMSGNDPAIRPKRLLIGCLDNLSN